MGWLKEQSRLSKSFLKKPAEDSLQTRLSRFLLQHRITPHTMTGTSPAELLLGRRPRTQLDLAVPDLNNKVDYRKQQHKKDHHDKFRKERHFQVGDAVHARKFPSNDAWIPGTIIKARGPLLYMIELETGQIVRRYVDHLQSRTEDSTLSPTSDWTDLPDISLDLHNESNQGVTQPEQPPLRHSTRVSVPPQRYSPEDFQS